MPSSTTLAGEWPCLWLDATHPKDCCRFGQGTFAGASVNDEEAPIADLPFLLLVMESAEAEPFQSTGTRLA
jgi:hypothetical protein